MNERETQRLAALARYEVMDTPREPSFDELAALTAKLCDAPIAVVNLIDECRQFFKAEVGLGVRETPLESSFCAKALLEDEFLLVPDTMLDARFDCNPLVTGEPHIRFYAGVLLKTDDGLPIGTLCVLDYRPRELTILQQETLRVLARQVMAQLDLRRIARESDVRHRDAQASEERLRLVLDSARDYAIITMDDGGRIESWSAGAEATFGQSGDEAIGQLFDDLFVPEDRAAGAPARELATAVAEGCAPDIRWHLRADGSRVFMNGSTHPIVDPTRHRTGFLKIARNETQQRTDADELARTRVELIDSEARYRTLFESIEAGFCEVEVRLGDTQVDYRVVEANPAFYRQTGFPVDILGRWLREAAPELEEHWFDTYGRIARTGEPIRFEQGSVALGRWFDVYAFRVGEAAACRVAILFSDISARRNAEEALQRLNETLEQQVAERTAERDRIWETSPDLLLVIDFAGVLRRVNPAWTTMLGYDAGELVGHHVTEFVLADDQEATIGAYELAAGGGLPRIVNRYRHKDGSIRWLSWVAVPAGDMTYATGRDVTAEREQAAALLLTEEQLRQAQKMEAVGQLTGGIAHDFNNLLTGVIGSLDLLQRRLSRGETDKMEKYANAAITSANRAAALTHRLLAFARRQPLDPRPVNANRLVTGMEELLRRTIGESIALEIVTAGGLWQTLCDPHQLESAILNLAINARDAMPGGGTLTIETCNVHLDAAYASRDRDVRAGQYICVCVSDTGDGMSQETIGRAFEPFFTTKPIGQGTGLGLSMIYGFTRQSEGYARIYSEEGKGTTIKLYLPRYYGAAEGADEAINALIDAQHAGAGEVVLVVEDETAVRDLVVEVLEELGYRAVEAADGPTGLRLLESTRRIDLLVTDIGLPGLNGRQVADAARLVRPELKVLFMTGYAENATIANGFLEPGMQMITKPFAIDALTTRIRDMIEGAGPG